MQFLEYRISADDSKIHDSCSGWIALRAQNYSQGVLLPGLPFYLEQPGRAHDRTALASLLSWRGNQLALGEKRVAEAEKSIRDAENAQRSTLNAHWAASELDVGRFPPRP